MKFIDSYRIGDFGHKIVRKMKYYSYFIKQSKSALFKVLSLFDLMIEGDNNTISCADFIFTL